MTPKSDVLIILPKIKCECELESGKRLIKLRIDRAPELKVAVGNLEYMKPQSFTHQSKMLRSSA